MGKILKVSRAACEKACEQTEENKMPKKCLKLLQEMKQTAVYAKKIQFCGVDGYDVYNTSPAFQWDGETWIVGRVERRYEEISCVRFFRKTGEYTYEVAYPELVFRNFQDPFVAVINGELVLGGVQIDINPLIPTEIINWRTCFFRGRHIEKLKLFAVSPNRMKDVRLGQMRDGKVAVFTRPIVGNFEKGRIGFTVLDSLDDLNESVMEQAPVGFTHFDTMEWGGVNQVHLLPDGMLGVLGHISYRCENNCLHYHVMTFIQNPQTGVHTPPEIILTRAMLPEGDSKRPNLKDVLFAGGMVRQSDGTATLYTGVSDCETWCVTIPDPFLAHEIQ